jgi:hypothetical protein
MLVLKFWPAMRMREISCLESHLVKYPLVGKYGHALMYLLTQNMLILF